jgi:MHS family proline/betaine transporter-like MFS transporter
MKHPYFHTIRVGLVANILEWYEFSIYAYLVTIMAQLYLPPGDSSIIALIKAWSAFSFSYLARPLGSFFWGYIGDKKGYSYSLRASLLTMAIPTTLIGLLPTYSSVGIFATLALFGLRFIQGFAAGGELPISACYVFETAPTQQRGLLCSTIAIGSGIGFLLGSAVCSILYYNFSIEVILNGLWRIPYLLSIPMTFCIFLIRRSIIQETVTQPVESNLFSIKEQWQIFKTLLQSGMGSLIVIVGFMEVCYYTLILYLPSYLTEFFHTAPQIAQTLNTVTLLLYTPCLLFAGYLADRIGYKRVLIMHALGIIVFIYPLFNLLKVNSATVLIAVQVLFAYLVSGLGAVMMEALGSAYPGVIRCSGMSITHTIAATIFGGPTPLFCTYLIHKTGIVLAPAIYMIAFGLLSMPILLRLPAQERI